MKHKIAPNFFFVIIAIIVGVALFKQFDFQTLTFEKPALAVVYGIVCVAAIGLMVRKSNSN